MAKDFKKVIIPFAVIFYFGGTSALHATIEATKELLSIGFPIFVDVAKQQIEDYLTSPYFLTGIILNVFAAFGIWLGHSKSKILYSIISIVIMAINTFSIICNLFSCTL